MKKNFNGSVLRSYSTPLGTAGAMSRMLTKNNFDCEHLELPGFHFGHDGSLDAPDVLPAGSTIAGFRPRSAFVCDAIPSACARA